LSGSWLWRESAAKGAAEGAGKIRFEPNSLASLWEAEANYAKAEK